MNFRNLLIASAGSLLPLCSFATDYFVTPAGAGSRDGLSWENAMSQDDMRQKADTFHDGDCFYFAEGTYRYQGRTELTVGCTLKGGFASTSTGTDTETKGAGRTVMDGNREFGTAFKINTATGAANTSKGDVLIEGFDFTNAHFGATTNTGALWLDNNTGSKVVVKNCHFSNNVCDQGSDTSSNGCGPCVLSHRSTAHFIDCTFTGNTATSRGGAVRLMSDHKDKGYTVFERCLFSGNKLTGTGGMGGAIFMSHGQQLDLVNCTLVDNQGVLKGGAVSVPNAPDGDFKRVLNVVSCTFANNEASQGTEIFLAAAGVANIANSVVVDNASMDGNAVVYVNGDASKVAFKGNCYAGKVTDGCATTSTDNQSADNTYATFFGTNTLNGEGVIQPVAAVGGMPGTELAALVGEQAWPVEVDAAVDQLGNARVAGSSTGAYAYVGGSTAIDAIHADKQSATFYNLSGQRVDNSYRGIVVKNGRKVWQR